MPAPAAESPSGLPSRVKVVVCWIGEEKARVVGAMLVAILGFLIMRGCIPAFQGDRLPADLASAVAEKHEHCDEDFPIWPGEVRMPTCDLVTVRSAGAGTVPAEQAARGVTRALCYHVDTEQLYWGEAGTWKHDMAWSLRTYSKVAVLQGGKWILFPDEDQRDRARWAEYACPGEYEATSGLVPRKS